MIKYSLVFLIISAVLYGLMFFQLDYGYFQVAVILVSAIGVSVMFFAGRHYVKASKEESLEIKRKAESEAARILLEAQLEINRQQLEIDFERTALTEKENELIQKAQDWDTKIKNYKDLLNKYKLKLSYQKEFLSKLKKLCFEKNRTAESITQEISRRLYNFKG